MQRNTNIVTVMDGNTDKSRYDAEIKKILSDKQILAWILKYTVKEFKQYSIKQIIPCIEGVPEIGTCKVRPGHDSEVIDGMNTEDAVPGEGRVTYDIRFRVVLPEGEQIGMIINVEAQKSYYPGYDIVTRGVFYCARLLSAQMGNDISAKEYAKLQKVYSIWICLDVPQKSEHTITGYHIAKEQIHGHASVSARYDLMELVMVYLGREATAKNGTKLHGLLTTLLSDTLKPAQKKKILEQEYEIATSVEEEGEMTAMCNLSDRIEEKGIQKGMEQGTMCTLFSLVQQGHISVEVAAVQANLSPEQFVKQLEEYEQQCGKLH